MEIISPVIYFENAAVRSKISDLFVSGETGKFVTATISEPEFFAVLTVSITVLLLPEYDIATKASPFFS